MQDLTIKVSDSNSENIALKQQLDSSHLEMNKMKDLLNKADQDAIELVSAIWKLFLLLIVYKQLWHSEWSEEYNCGKEQ